MISHIEIKNFKSLKDISVKLQPLNILMGLNGMGKSSFIQSLLMLLQSDELDKGIINLNGPLVDLGLGRDVLYQFSEVDYIELGVSFNNSVDYKWKFNYRADTDKLKANASIVNNDLEYFRRATDNFQFIAAERIGPRESYEASKAIVTDKKYIGLSGEYAAYYLNQFGSKNKVPAALQHGDAIADTLLEQTNAWLGEISPGVTLATKYLPEINKVILDYQYTLPFGKTNAFKPKNVGFGITYVLPVIVSLLTAEKGKIIIIENPESHVHPRGQAELGKLIALAASTGAQLFIETHSDHILNGIRVAVKEKLIAKESANIIYFEKETTQSEQYSKTISIKIDKNGELSKYPKDFLDEWNNQLLKLV